MSGLGVAAARGASDEERADRLAPIESVLVGVAVVGGVALRCWSPAALWLDEALSVNIAQLPLGDIPEALRHDGHPPLYYALLHGWIDGVGASDAQVRGLSVLFGLALLPLAFLLGRMLAGSRAGWYALAITAASPYAIRYSSEARMYALVMLLAAAAALLVRGALQRPTPPRLLGIALCAAALLLTHYWALWLGAATAVVLVVVARRQPDARRAALLVLGALAAGAVAFVPWLGVLAEQAAHTGTPWAPPTRPTAMVAMTLGDLGGINVRDAELLGFLLLLAGLLALLARPVDAHRLELDLRTVAGVRGEAAVVALTLAIGGSVGLLSGTTYMARYAAVIVPLVLTMAAVGLTRAPSLLSRATLLAALVVGGLGIGAVNQAEERTQLRAHAEAIEAAAAPDDVVVVCPDQLGPGLRRGLAPERTVLAYPLLDDGSLVNWTDYAERNQADPAAVARSIEARTPASAAIFVSWGGDYRTLEGRCEQLVAELALHRPVRSTLVLGDGEVYEHATLTRLAPQAP